MPPENVPPSDRPSASSPSDNVPAIEDAYALDDSSADAVGEDDPQLLGAGARALEGEAAHAADNEVVPPATPAGLTSTPADKDDTTDAEGVADELDSSAHVVQEAELPDWDNELSAHKIVVELKRVESEVRRLLEGNDTKRKRKLGGTSRWLELEEDLIAWRFGGRVGETTLRRLLDLVARRHYLFRRLRFLAGTRPTWNT
jgi:hypothetical protein